MFLPKLTPIEIEAIQYRWSLGETADSLAKCFEVDPATIRRRCRGIDTPRRKSVPVETVVRLRESGATIEEIADRLDFEPKSLLRAIRREQARAAA